LIPDLDIYRSANLLVQQHGEDAPIKARVVKKLGRALGASLVWSDSTPTRQVVPGSSDLLRPIEDGANS
jgi:hypothetical protein